MVEGGQAESVRFSPHGKILLRFSDRFQSRDPVQGQLLESREGEDLGVLWQAAAPPTDCGRAVSVLSPDGQTRATPDRLGQIHLTEAATGQERACLPGHTPIRGLVFRDDGRTLVSVTGAQAVEATLWESAASPRV
jgi:hypothetical protein